MTAPESFDVIVLGGGIAGAATAWALARGGDGRPPLRTLLVDAYAPGHEHGSSHGDGRIVRFTYPEPTYLEMARRVYPLWSEIEDASGESLLQITGSWECGPGGCPHLGALREGLAAAEIPFESWTAAESRRRFPHFELPLGSEVVYQSSGAVVRAGRAVAALWDLAQGAGALAVSGQRIDHVSADDEGVEVRGGGYRWRGERLVITAGGWSGELLRQLDLELPLEVTREVVAYFPVSKRTASSHVDHRAGMMPTLVDYHHPQPFYAVPQIDVPGVKVGWHRTGPPVRPGETGDADPVVAKRIQDYVADRLPYLELRPLKVMTCLYTNTPDYHFVLDRHPALSRVVVGTGFSGHGFKFGPVLGEILACLAAEVPPPVDLDTFRIDRLFGARPPAPRLTA
ncbi:MAG: N-methyl-L-tryptophan oxidase [Acidobacteriota bacterium]